MAASASLCGMPRICCGTQLSRRHGVGGGFPKRDLKFTVRSMAEEQEQEDENVAAQAKVGSIWDVLAFSGPGPERINGRLAMIGFVAAMGVEVVRGEDLFSQVQDGGGVAWFLGTTALLSLASLIPLVRGVSAESKSGTLMTSDAELWNGRFAMLGLLALAFTEYLKGGPLV